MPRGKVHVTRTYAPIHFEDLDPHRFEDLIRELIYDFRDWQTIEATGRSGSDQGFDVRAFEKVLASPPTSDEEGEAEEPHPMDGQRWMIQGKREKELAPAEIRRILADVDATDPPYGYILAASAVFSKRSFDLFRDELRAKGVMEFYLWGRPELEGMLHLPKNDRILFTFFGISLVSRRRSRTTEIRSTVTVKNKLYKVLGTPDGSFHTTMLLRDLNDQNYPFRDEYPDFEQRPRWVERVAFGHHPLGFLIHCRRHYAYVDRDNKEWDYTDEVNLIWPQVITDEERNKQRDKLNLAEETWKFLPRSRQGELKITGLIRYEDVQLVDAEGDTKYRFPHIYVDFRGKKGPVWGSRETLNVGTEELSRDESWRRIQVFPKEPLKPKLRPRILEDYRIKLDAETLKAFLKHSDDADTLFAVDDRFDFLRQRDIVQVAETPEETFFQLMHVYKGPFDDYIRRSPAPFKLRRFAERQVGRTLAKGDLVTALEVEQSYRWKFEKDAGEGGSEHLTVPD